MVSRKQLELQKAKKDVEAQTRKLRRDPSWQNYLWRGESYLELRDYDSAITDFHTAQSVSDHTSTYFLERIGVANWLAKREYLAAATWLELTLAMERGKIQYADGSGGVQPGCLLWFAGVSLRYPELLVPARRLLEAKVRSGHGRNWSIENWLGSVAKYLLGIFDESQLRERIKDIPIVRERELCQVEFYVGVRALEQGDPIKAKKSFCNAARLHEASIESEYDLAQRESRRRDLGRGTCCP